MLRDERGPSVERGPGADYLERDDRGFKFLGVGDPSRRTQVGDSIPQKSRTRRRTRWAIRCHFGYWVTGSAKVCGVSVLADGFHVAFSVAPTGGLVVQFDSDTRARGFRPADFSGMNNGFNSLAFTTAVPPYPV
jgi:hypothetical protein